MPRRRAGGYHRRFQERRDEYSDYQSEACVAYNLDLFHILNSKCDNLVSIRYGATYIRDNQSNDIYQAILKCIRVHPRIWRTNFLRNVNSKK